MAYRFSNTSDYVRFSPAPLTGYTIGPVTIACLFKRAAGSAFDTLVALADSGITAWRANLTAPSTAALRFTTNLTASEYGSSLTSTTIWYLGAVTWTGSGVPRLHLWNGTSWAHTNGGTSLSSFGTVTGTDILVASVTTGGGAAFLGDMTCVGIKKADSSDATIETLSATAWSAWTAFGFDWLIGFDSSLETGGILQDQGAAGTGDETAISGTSAVADPAGWSWAGAPGSTFVPKIIVVS